MDRTSIHQPRRECKCPFLKMRSYDCESGQSWPNSRLGIPDGRFLSGCASPLFTVDPHPHKAILSFDAVRRDHHCTATHQCGHTLMKQPSCKTMCFLLLRFPVLADATSFLPISISEIPWIYSSEMTVTNNCGNTVIVIDCRDSIEMCYCSYKHCFGKANISKAQWILENLLGTSHTMVMIIWLLLRSFKLFGSVLALGGIYHIATTVYASSLCQILHRNIRG